MEATKRIGPERAVRDIRAALTDFIQRVDAIAEEEVVGALLVMMLEANGSVSDNTATPPKIAHGAIDWIRDAIFQLRMFQMVGSGIIAVRGFSKKGGPLWGITDKGRELGRDLVRKGKNNPEVSHV